MSPSSCTYRRAPVSILPAASAKNMNASSASGLCARWMVRPGSAGTSPSGPALRRLRVEGVEVVLVIGVFGSLAGALGRLVLEEVAVRPVRARRVAPQLERAGAQHEREQMRRDGAADGIRLGERRGVIPARQVEHAKVVARVDVERRQ